MADNQRRKCLKCGRSPKEDPDVKLHRFPKPGPTNILRCEKWARFCFPGNEWQSTDFQRKLYGEHKMLCSKHFNESEFIDFDKKVLHRHGAPNVECCEQPVQTLHTSDLIPGPSKHVVMVRDLQPGPSHILMDITNIKPVATEVPVSVTTRHILDPTSGPSRNLDITYVKPVAKQIPVLVPAHDLIDPTPGPSYNLDIINVKPVAKSLPCTDQDKIKTLYKKCRHKKNWGAEKHN